MHPCTAAGPKSEVSLFGDWGCPRCALFDSGGVARCASKCPFFEFGGVRGVPFSSLLVLRGVLRGVPFSCLVVSEVCLFEFGGVARCASWCAFLEFGGVRGARSRVWRCFRSAESGPYNTIKSLRTPARRPRLGKGRILVSYSSQLGTKKKKKTKNRAPKSRKHYLHRSESDRCRLVLSTLGGLILLDF